jgi:hypothetical protein
MSNLLLSEKTLLVAEGNEANELEKTGGNQWDALRASHRLILSEPFSSVMVCLFNQARTYFQNK